MNRLLLILLALGFVSLSLGCTMCSQEYDYCPPTFTGHGYGMCDPRARANSILASPLPLATGGTMASGGEVIYELPDG